MKRIIIISVLLSQLLMACEQVAGYFANESSDSAKAGAVNFFGDATPDNSITAENAYSDLFLDSIAISNYIRANNVPDSVAQMIRSFYNSRNYQYAWLNSDGLTEQGKAFWNLYDYYKKDSSAIDRRLESRIDSLMMRDSSAAVITTNAATDSSTYKKKSAANNKTTTATNKKAADSANKPGTTNRHQASVADSGHTRRHVATADSSVVTTELALTREFVHYALNNPEGAHANAVTLFRFIPVKKMAVMQLADSLTKGTNEDSIAVNQPYSLLRKELKKYYDLAQKGGWKPIPATARQIKKGTSSSVVSEIKRRLKLTGDYTANDSSEVYNDSLFVAVKSYQKRYGLDTSGIITDSLISVMNVPVEKRMEQIIVNMYRMAWMPMPQEGRFLEVNIPLFMLSAYENSSKAFDMPVIVGKEGTNTLMFSGNLNQVVFNPYWNIPESIVRNELLPAMKQDPSYLKKNHMEIVEQNGDIPKIRQLPGPHNAMGRMKFLFPNDYDIYLHDTPAKDLFANQKRAFSHGCIRVQNAQLLAEYLLKNNPQWTPEKIKAAVNSYKEQYVKLDNPVPVMITYFTAWVDDKGQLNFRDDVYGRDQEIASRMFMHTSDQRNMAMTRDSAAANKNDSALARP